MVECWMDGFMRRHGKEGANKATTLVRFHAFHFKDFLERVEFAFFVSLSLAFIAVLVVVF